MNILAQELVQRSVTAIFLIFVGLYIFFVLPAWCFSLLMFLTASYTVAIEMPHVIPYKGLNYWLLIAFYPLLPFLLIIVLNQDVHYRMLVFLAFITACSNDMGAYFAGKLCGRHKIFPAISPKKTWEGFVGGFLLTSLALYLITYYNNKDISYHWLLIFGLLVALVGTAGDFFESWLKRKAHIKDSGNLLPGHGGILDRFDSILFIIVCIYCCKDLLRGLFF